MQIKLEEGEYLFARVHRHWTYWFFPLVIATILFPITFGMPYLWFFYKLARFFVDDIVLTNKNFHVRVGLFEKEMRGLPLDKISEVKQEQGFWGRKLGYGTIYAHTASTYGGVDYPYIAKPEIVKNAIEQAVAASKVNENKGES